MGRLRIWSRLRHIRIGEKRDEDEDATEQESETEAEEDPVTARLNHTDPTAGDQTRQGCAEGNEAARKRQARLNPPPAPIRLTPLVACDPETSEEILWHIARYAPTLRKWVVANTAASPLLLEYISQQGGPGVKEALQMLLDVLEEPRHSERKAR